MAKETYAVILRLDNPEVNKGFFVSTSLPVARIGEKSVLKYEWNEGNKFQTEVPTKITYKDDYGHTQVFHLNYAKFLLEKYPFLKAVKTIEKEDIKIDEIKIEPEVETVESVPVKQEKKEKKNEK